MLSNGRKQRRTSRQPGGAEISQAPTGYHGRGGESGAPVPVHSHAWMPKSEPGRLPDLHPHRQLTSRRFAQPLKCGHPAEAMAGCAKRRVEQSRGGTSGAIWASQDLRFARAHTSQTRGAQGRHEAGTTTDSAIRAARCEANLCSEHHGGPKVQGHLAAGGRGVSEHGISPRASRRSLRRWVVFRQPGSVVRLSGPGVAETGAPGRATTE